MATTITAVTNLTLIGDAGKNTLTGKGGNDYLDGKGGADALSGGAGKDILVYDALDTKIDGGSGFDTLLFQGTAQRLNLTGNKVVAGIEELKLFGGGSHQVSFTAADVIRVSNNDRLKIWGNSTNIVSFNDSGWTFNGFTSDGFMTLRNGGAAVDLQMGLKVTNVSNNATITFGPGSDKLVVEDETAPSLTASGSFVVSDPNGQNLLTTQVTPVNDAGNNAPLGTLVLGSGSATGISNNNYTYTVANAAAQYLGSNDKKTETFSVTSIDGTVKQFQFDIQGVNDAPVREVTGTDIITGSVSEIPDGQPGENSTSTTLHGSFVVRDVDLSDTLSVWIEGASSARGSLMTAQAADPVNAGNTIISWTYVVSDNSLDSMNEGQKLIDTLTIKISDRPQGTAGAAIINQAIAIELTGANDQPTIYVPTPSKLIEDTNATPQNTLVSAGIITVVDPDQGQAALDLSNFNGTGKWGTLSIDTHGAYLYVVDNQSIDGWNADRTETDSFALRSIDGSTADITFTIQGKDDPSVITGGDFSDAFAEDPPALNPDGTAAMSSYLRSGQIYFTDVDNAQPSDVQIKFEALPGVPGLSTSQMPVYLGNGQFVADWIVSYEDFMFDSLKAGDVANYVYRFTITSASGVTTTQDITITVQGADDPIVGDNNDNKLLGTAKPDVISGLGGVDGISGLDGDDIIYGGAGNDELYGDSGNDRLIGDSGNDFIDGSDGHDTLDGGTEDDTLYGGTGNDVLAGGSGNDILDGNQGNDSLDGGAGDDTIYGGSGNDILTGGSGNDVIFGDDGDDTVVVADAENLTFLGGAGNDLLNMQQVSGAAVVTATGGTGSDRYYLNPAEGNQGAPAVSLTVTDFDINGFDGEVDLFFVPLPKESLSVNRLGSQPTDLHYELRYTNVDTSYPLAEFTLTENPFPTLWTPEYIATQLIPLGFIVTQDV